LSFAICNRLCGCNVVIVIFCKCSSCFFVISLDRIVPVNVSFGSQSNTVFSELSDAFMRSGVFAVEYLLAAGVKGLNLQSKQNRRKRETEKKRNAK
jgi:hypothetical protein